MKMNESSYLTSAQAAEFLRYSMHTLKLSRHTGILAGVDAPSYKKLGRRVLYEIATLEMWLEQFPEQTHNQ